MILRHLRQQTDYSCAATAFAIYFGCTEEEGIAECRTTRKGTNMCNLKHAVRLRGLVAHEVAIGEDFHSFSGNLLNISRHFPVFINGEFRDRFFAKGRDRCNQHCVLVADGMVYDPSEKEPIELEAYEVVFKKLRIDSFVIVDKEIEGYGRNK
jgi:hypothetical protein